MSDARARILADVRAALRRTEPLPPSVARGLEQRVAAPQANVQPAVDGDVVERFVAKMTAVNGLVTRLPDRSGISAALEAHCERHHVPTDIVVAPDPALDDIAWSNRFSIERRAARGEDRLSVTGAYAGIAETGTLVLLSGPESPTSLNFLPDDHVVVLDARRVVRHIEDAWATLRSERRTMPRTVNLITGPSKTGDIEQKIHEGAHGPRRLHVLLIG
ncbi:MAG: lactate utilization protein [Ectothiorhodospiraceae bacterium]|nr:lactate utilization protein [Chromatiales bacterium]MCP5157026.1 lactate utilization protein [Ectothiorhodospiraceae bacterium]